MSTRSFVALQVCVLSLLVAATPARAQEDQQPRVSEGQKQAVEITPFVSIGSIFSSRIGAAIAFAWTSTLSVEAEAGYRRGEIDALSSRVSLLYALPGAGRIVPYLAAGVGLEQYGAPVQAPGFGVFTQQKTAFTVNAGGGVKVPVGGTWGYRADVRWVNSVGRDGPEHWRVYNGVTLRR